MLLSKIQRTKVESKSQLSYVRWTTGASCYQKYKEQKLKANHNWSSRAYEVKRLLSKIQRTKVESKSQHTTLGIHDFGVVIKNTKNKSWKQITTRWRRWCICLLLLSKIQRTKVESKSQHHHPSGASYLSCYQKYKEQKLKANHN